MLSKKKDPDKYDYQGENEHKDGNAVDAMHVAHPCRNWRIWVSFPDV